MVKIYLFISMIGILSNSYANDNLDIEDMSHVMQSFCEVCEKGLSNKQILFTLTSYPNKHLTTEYYHNYHIIATGKEDINSKELAFLEEELGNRFRKESSAMVGAYYFLKGKLFLQKGILSEAYSSLQRVLQLSCDTKPSISIYENMASVHLKKKEYKKAILLLEKAEMALSEYPTSRFLIKIEEGRGHCYMHLQNYEAAEMAYKNAIAFGEQFDEKSSLPILYMNLASLYDTQFKKKATLLLYQKALTIAKAIKNPLTLKAVYINMAMAKEKMFSYKEALTYYKKYNKINDSLGNGEHIWKFATEKKKIELSKKNAKISLLEKCNLDYISALKTQKTLFKALIISNLTFFVVVCLGICFYKIMISKKEIVKVQNKSLNALNKLKDELLSVLAHDLRSPAHHLIAVTDQMGIELQEGKGNVDKLSELVRVGSSAANKTYLLLDNLLHWILLHNKSIFFQKENINLPSLLDQVSHVFLPVLEMKQIQFEIEIPEQVEVYGDINSLKVVLRNLIDNAIKFTPNHGGINIKITQNNKEVILSIADTGIGMDDSTLKELPNSLIKIAANTKGGKSTGLGLQLCFSFVKRNGGVLTIRSKENIGTTVFVKLPNSKCIKSWKR